MGGFPTGDGGRAMVSIYFYGESASTTAAAEQPKWTAWLPTLFQSVAT